VIEVAMPRRLDDEDDDAPRPKKKKKRKPPPKSNKGLIIGLAIAGGVLLLGGVATTVYFLTRSDPKPEQKREEFPGMLAHWSFDDSTGKDQTGRGNDGRLVGGSFGPGKKGNALVLEGRDDQYMDLGQGKDMNFYENGAFTVALWYKTNERVGTLFSLRHAEMPATIDLFVRDNHALGIVGDDTDDGSGPARHAFCWCHPLNDGQWHHVALMRYENFIEIFYDGNSQGKDTHGACRGKITTSLRAIGCEKKFVQEEEKRFGRAGFRGTIDEVYLFNRPMAQDEILKLMKR
jgi:hypothetical protein